MLQTDRAINGRCAAVRGAILGSQGVSFVLQVRRLPNGEGMFWGRGTRPDLARLPPPGLQDVTGTGPLSPVGIQQENKRQKKEQAVSQPGEKPPQLRSR